MNLNTSYLVNEIYPCLQGEGPRLGTPSILVRFQICNLRCTWCDTPYTHTMKSDPIFQTKSSGQQKFKRLSLDNLISTINEHQKIRHVILSGGEPTLQNIALIALELHSTHSIEVETNGTQIPHKLHKSFHQSHYALMNWNVSPKGKNAGERLNLEAMRHWAELSTSNCSVNFKFVIRKEHACDDLGEIESIISDTDIPEDKIILMSEGTSAQSQLENVWLENICLQRGWKMTPRLHVLTHGSLRGV